MKTECARCRFSELKILGEYLTNGSYYCSLGCDMECESCSRFERDPINQGFEFSYPFYKPLTKSA